MTWLAAVALGLAVALRPGRGRDRLPLQAPARVAPVTAALAGVGAAAAALVRGVEPVTVLLGAAGAAATVSWWRRASRERRRRALRREAVVLAHALAAELRSGAPPPAALSAAADRLTELRVPLLGAARAAQHGADAAAELHRIAVASGCTRLEPVAAAWEVLGAVGAPVASVLDDVGAALAADDELHAEVDALLAGPRATVTVLALLPVGALGLATALGSDPLRLLLHSPAGHAAAAAALLLELAGIAWMRTLVRRSVRLAT